MVKIVFLLILLSFYVVIPAYAHPHVFIDNKLIFSFNTKGLAGISVQWTFDEMYSSTIIFDFDDGDGVLSEQENAVVKKENFNNLKEYGFFLDIVIDRTPFTVVFVQDFVATIKDGQLVYCFFVPCHVSAGSHIKTIQVGVVDETSFVAITTQKEDVVRQSTDYSYKTELTFTPTSEFLQMMS
ncbi:MAG: DUF1007 family protein, partial [Deltaproteobacteria bacterium]|nr:DUF1007 family protein [Deltaproteobacteria bacterium]